MTATSNQEMHRSISMPATPKHLEIKVLQRSEEKETICPQDYYPESPLLGRSKHPNVSSMSHNADDSSESISKSANNFILYSDDWAGSTIELNADLRRNEIDICPRKRPPYRVIEKNGRENILFRRIPEKSWRYIRDFVTTLIEIDWIYTLSIFVGSYVFSWFFFALLCYMVAYSHGDLLFDEITGERLGEGKEPCIIGVYNFVSMLIYSIETQTTVGFGEKYPSEECPETIFLFIMQIICSIAIEGGMVSVIYAKTARPVRQITKLKFSDKAVICYRDGKLCLLFRVCDTGEKQSIGTKIRLYLILDRPTREGEIIKTHTEMKLEGKGQQIIAWPEVVCHIIDDSSPLRHLNNAKKLNAAQFELYVSIVGESRGTAQITEARTSYVPREIFWGQRFINIISYDAVNERYSVDYSNFNTTISVDMTNDDSESHTKH